MGEHEKREYARSDNGVADKGQKYEMLRNKSNLKKVTCVRFADDCAQIY